MRRWLSLVIAAIVGSALMVPVGDAADRSSDQLNVYTADVDGKQLSQLVEQGFDVSGQRKERGRRRG